MKGTIESRRLSLGVVAFGEIVHIEPQLPQPKPRAEPKCAIRHVVQMAKYKRAGGRR